MHVTCDTCGIPIQWEPTIAGKGTYCCTGCAEGGPCTCDYGLLPRPDERAALVRREAAGPEAGHGVENKHTIPQATIRRSYG